jgi:nitrogen fixation protein FixH
VKGDRWWPIALGGVLAITIVANAVLFWVATRGEGPAVERDYYRRAVRWDSTLAEQQRSAALGWRVTATLSPPGGAVAWLTVAVSDAAGAPVEGARARVEGFAVAHQSLQLDAPLREVRPGAYGVGLAVTRTEWHEFRITLERGVQRFVVRVRCLPGQACHVR